METISGSARRGTVLTVCVVEDDEIYCEVLASLINDAGEFRCLGTYRWAEHALEGIPKKNPDLVVVDIVLPRMRGSECIWRLKQRLPTLRALVLTGQSSEKVLFEALAAGADGYLEKPCLKEELLQELRGLSGGKTPLAERARQLILRYFREHGPKAFLAFTLTDREREVLVWADQGLSDEAIAQRLGVAPSTVHSHFRHLYEKLGVHNRTAALRYLRSDLS